MLLNINYINSKQYEDGERISSSDSLFENYYFRFNKSITPLISYQLYLRANLTNSHTEDTEGNETTTYQRAIEPSLDIFFRNPVYGLTAGYRRLEQWSTAHLRDESRITTDFYYSRFDLTPRELPALSLQFDRQKEYDYLSPRTIDSTTDRYSGSTWYDLTYKGANLSYNVTYTRNENKTPADETISKTINTIFSALYNIAYNKSFWEDSVGISAGYQGNYVRNKNEQFATQIGDVEFERMPSLGLYALGTQVRPRVDTLVSTITLSDDIYDSPATTASGTINLGQNGERFHNLGIQLFSSERSVDSLFIYVNKDITTDMNLTNPGNWRVFRSDFNLPGTWVEIIIQNVSVTLFDRLNNIYRYEIRFAVPQNALFFSAINMERASVNDVLVTEIEAFGTDVIPQSGKIIDTTTFFTQGINLTTNIRPIKSLIFTLNYFLNRADEHPESVLDSIEGAFSNIFTRPEIEKEARLKTNITRTYGAGTTWLTHRFLTTAARFQRNEAFDNKAVTDFSSDTYSLDFSSSPLPTLDTKLSLIRTIGYDFEEKQSESDLYLLTIGAKLYRDVNMITDIGYIRSKTFSVDAESSSLPPGEEMRSTNKYIRGTIDARLTETLYGNLVYGLSRISGDTSSTSKEGALILTYRPGRFISFTGNFRLSDVDGDTDTTEGIFVDWLFLPAIRLNVGYEHQNREQESRTLDNLSGYILWYVTKFIDLQLNYNYLLEKDEKRTETYNIGANLTCRFW
ncbi:MAG: hypothetical protein AB1390_04460 [Nitrospirota bacterium]